MMARLWPAVAVSKGSSGRVEILLSTKNALSFSLAHFFPGHPCTEWPSSLHTNTVCVQLWPRTASLYVGLIFEHPTFSFRKSLPKLLAQKRPVERNVLHMFALENFGDVYTLLI